jgi:hypothetical protein
MEASANSKQNHPCTHDTQHDEALASGLDLGFGIMQMKPVYIKQTNKQTKLK